MVSSLAAGEAEAQRLPQYITGAMQAVMRVISYWSWATQGTHWPQAMSKEATTRSPTLKFLTSGPTLSMMPMNCDQEQTVY